MLHLTAAVYTRKARMSTPPPLPGQSFQVGMTGVFGSRAGYRAIIRCDTLDSGC
jgi:hypothetical protein